jgi:hypothetical protein
VAKENEKQSQAQNHLFLYRNFSTFSFSSSSFSSAGDRVPSILHHMVFSRSTTQADVHILQLPNNSPRRDTRRRTAEVTDRRLTQPKVPE